MVLYVSILESLITGFNRTVVKNNIQYQNEFDNFDKFDKLLQLVVCKV